MRHEVTAPAKINLSLDITGKRNDGYHNLKTIMHTVNLCDKLIFEENNSGKINIISNNKFVPDNEKNVVFQACRDFYALSGKQCAGFDIKLIKKIPVSAGLAGGSSDAAAALKFLNGYYDNPLSRDELLKAGEKSGADIPYCLTGGTCLCEGIGEIITPLHPLPPCRIIIAKPTRKGLSTKRVFSSINFQSISLHPDTAGIIKALEEQNLKEISKRMYNVLEEHSVKLCPEILKLKETLCDSGALNAIMSGSGSSVFGIFPPQASTDKATEKLKKITSEVFII